MIWEELKESLIFTKLSAVNYQEVMEKIGGALIQEGYGKESYVKALIDREAEFPTGLDVDGIGVAIPHTDVSHVKRQGVAIAVLKQPVTFLQMGTDDEEVEVEIVFMLAVVNPSEHMERLQRILAMIQDTKVLQKLKKAKTKTQMIEIVKEKESTL